MPKQTEALQRPEDDAPRQALRALIAKRKDIDLKAVSLAIGKNHSYLFQYLNYGKPSHLPEDVREALGLYFGTPAELFRKGERRAVKVRTAIDIRRLGESVELQEMDVAAAAGLGEEPLAGYSEAVIATWSIPSAAYVQLSNSPADRVKIISVVGDSMAPTLQPGQRVMVDTTDKTPSPPGLFVLWDGLSFVIKRIELVPGSEPLVIRLISDNSRYTSYERTLDEAHIGGRVIGMWART